MAPRSLSWRYQVRYCGLGCWMASGAATLVGVSQRLALRAWPNGYSDRTRWGFLTTWPLVGQGTCLAGWGSPKPYCLPFVLLSGMTSHISPLIASGGTLSPPPDGGGAGLQRRVLNPPLKNVICQQGDVRKVRWGKLTRHRLLPDGVNSYVGPQPTPFTYISTMAALNPAQKPETFTLCLMKLREIHTGLCPHFLTQGNTLGSSRVMGEVRVPTLSS